MMEPQDAAGLVIALVAANWSALGVAAKCRDKIDSARNLLWGVSGTGPPRSKAQIDFIIEADIVGFAVALISVFTVVGILLIAFAYVLQNLGVHGVLYWLYGVSGVLMILGAVVVGWYGRRDLPKIKQIAYDQFELQSARTE